MTPSQVRTSLWTFCMRTFLPKEARAQHTLTVDRVIATLFRSRECFNRPLSVHSR